MRTRCILWTFGLLALGLPGAGQAQVILDVVDAVIHASPGSVVLVNGYIQNGTEERLYLNDLVVSAPEPFVEPDVLEPFLQTAPEFLEAGEGWEGPLARLTIDAAAPLAPVICSVNLTGGSHPYDVVDLGVVHFVVDDSTAVTGVGPGVSRPAGELSARPNPFRSSTAAHFSLPAGDDVEISVYDVEGKLVRRLMKDPLPPGDHDVTWDGQDEGGAAVGSGFYFIRVRSREGLRTTKVVRIE